MACELRAGQHGENLATRVNEVRGHTGAALELPAEKDSRAPPESAKLSVGSDEAVPTPPGAASAGLAESTAMALHKTAREAALRASVIQFRSTPDRQATLARAAVLVRDSAQSGARLIALPELFAWRGPQDDEPAAAELVPGPTSDFASILDGERPSARQSNC